MFTGSKSSNSASKVVRNTLSACGTMLNQRINEHEVLFLHYSIY